MYVGSDPRMRFGIKLDVIALEGMEIKQPSLDLSCGDGIFSFLLAGGRFGRNFDIFQGAGNLGDFYDNTDIYDASPQSYYPTITERPEYNITVGTDWKPNLLEKLINWISMIDLLKMIIISGFRSMITSLVQYIQTARTGLIISNCISRR